MWHLIISSNTRFTLSVCPSVCGWFPLDIDGKTPTYLQNSVKNFPVNLGSLSQIMSPGNPNWVNTCRWSNSAVPFPVTAVKVGIRITYFVNLSTTTRMASYPEIGSFGNVMMKSIDMDKNGMWGNCGASSIPKGAEVVDFERLQISQVWTYSCTCFNILCQ